MLPGAAASVRRDEMNPFSPFKKVKSAKLSIFLSTNVCRLYVPKKNHHNYIKPDFEISSGSSSVIGSEE